MVCDAKALGNRADISAQCHGRAAPDRVLRAAEVRIYNQGPPVEPTLIGKIFEYGVSGCAGVDEAGGHRGQGLFVARTYMAKMGGTVEAVNCDDGVDLVLRLALAKLNP